MTHLNDAELLLMVQNDHEMAFNIIYNRYQPIMLSVAKRKLLNDLEAEDIVQEIFMSLWFRRKCISLNVPLKYYLLRAVHLQFAYKCRSAAVARKHDMYIENDSIDHDYSKQLESKELGERILTAIMKISAPACRKIFELAYIHDKSCNEIANLLNIQKQVVRNQTSRALKVLRNELKKVV